MTVAEDMETARELIGGFGKFQWIIFLCTALGDMRALGVLYGFSFYELEPNYLCRET